MRLAAIFDMPKVTPDNVGELAARDAAGHIAEHYNVKAQLVAAIADKVQGPWAGAVGSVETAEWIGYVAEEATFIVVAHRLDDLEQERLQLFVDELIAQRGGDWRAPGVPDAVLPDLGGVDAVRDAQQLGDRDLDSEPT